MGDRTDEILKLLGAMDARLGAMDARLGAMDARLGAMEGRFDRLEATVNEGFDRQGKVLNRIAQKLLAPAECHELGIPSLPDIPRRSVAHG